MQAMEGKGLATMKIRSHVGGNLSDVHIGAICAVLALVVFAIDVMVLPLGVAAGVAYVPAVLVALWLPRWQDTFIVAGAASILTILGFALSEPAGIPWMVVANRLLALATIWLTAIGGNWLIVTKRRKADESIRHARLERDKARSAKLRFLLTASNDIRHHLQTLVLLNGALQRTVTEDRPRHMISGQGDALGHLSDLMNSLLDLTEIESGEVQPKVEKVRLNDLFETLDGEFRDNARAKKIELEIDPSSEVIWTDPRLLTQALRSLLSNAIRYTDQGKVTVRCRREPGGLRVNVRDTGIGIPDDHLANIFDEFYRVENDPAGRNGGLGLGLTIVQHIARLLGIKLDVESEPGRGSRFSLLLPAAAEAA